MTRVVIQFMLQKGWINRIIIIIIIKHRQRNGRRRFATEADWAKGFVFGGENEV